MDLNIKRLISLTAFSFVLVISGCKDNSSDNGDGDGNGSGNDIPAVYADLPGTKISSDTTWTGNLTLKGQYYVLPGATLTIEAGTTIEWEYHNEVVEDVGALITLPADAENFATPQPSGRLVAEGTADKPIVFTSARSTKLPGDWGGIVLAGAAPNNIDGGKGEIEGLPQTIQYGGDEAADDSGILSYVRIEYVGFSFATDSELNGLSLYSVGSGTTLDHIQVYKCTDDGFEWFGGNVSAKYLVSMFNDDDSFDMDEGWVGNGQFWLAVQADNADNGFESDGVKTLGSGNETNPTLYNITLVGHGAIEGGDDNNGMYLKEEFNGDLNNMIIADFGGFNWLVADDTDSFYNDGLSFDNMIVFNNLSGWDGNDGTTYANDYTEVDPGFVSPGAPDFNYTPQAAEAATGQGQTPPSASGFFTTSATYLGAFDPEAAEPWIFEGSWLRINDN